jgi:AcrR family transcriptional regulator
LSGERLAGRSTPDPIGPIEDFRSRTARQRRHRTSRRLIEAVFSIVDQGRLPQISVDDIRRTAGLSHGALYRYFPTLDALLAHVSAAIGATINAEMSALFDAVPDPALRVGLHLRHLVRRASSDPSCVTLLSQTMPVTGAVSEFARDHARRDFAEGQDAGRFRLASLDVAVDLGHGMASAMLRRAAIDGYNEARVSLETTLLLRAFGVEYAEAAHLAMHPLPPSPSSDLRSEVLLVAAEDPA